MMRPKLLLGLCVLPLILVGCATMAVGPSVHENSMPLGYLWVPDGQTPANPAPYPYAKVDPQLPRVAAQQLYSVFSVATAAGGAAAGDTSVAHWDWLWDWTRKAQMGGQTYGDDVLPRYFKDSGDQAAARRYQNAGLWAMGSRLALGATLIGMAGLASSVSSQQGKALVGDIGGGIALSSLLGIFWGAIGRDLAVDGFNGKIRRHLGLEGGVPGQEPGFGPEPAKADSADEGPAPLPLAEARLGTDAQKQAWIGHYQLQIYPFKVGPRAYPSASLSDYLERCGQPGLAGTYRRREALRVAANVGFGLGLLGVCISSLAVFNPDNAGHFNTVQQAFWISGGVAVLSAGTSYWAGHAVVAGVEAPYNRGLRARVGLKF